MAKTSLSCTVGDIVQVMLDPTLGSEIKKTRPCLVIVAESPLDIVTVLPITADSGKTHSSFFAPIEASKECGLSKNSLIDCLQIRTIASARITKVLGRADDDILTDVRRRLAIMFDIGEEHL